MVGRRVADYPVLLVERERGPFMTGPLCTPNMCHVRVCLCVCLSFGCDFMLVFLEAIRLD